MPSIVRKKITYSGNIHDTQPVGEIINFDNEIPPLGYLPCDGRSVLRSTHSELFKKIGTKYGAEDDEHFNLPTEDDVGKNAIIKIEEDSDENFDDDTYIHVNGKDEKNPKKIIVKKIIKLLDYIKNKLIVDNDTNLNSTWSSEKIQDKLNEQGWKYVSTVGIGVSVNLPSDWKEAYFVAYVNTGDENLCYPFHILRDSVVGGKIHRFYSGYTYTTTDFGGARIDVTETRCFLNWFRFNGAGYGQANLSVRYR